MTPLIGSNGRKLRLLLTTDAVGGVWQYSLDLARGLEPLGVETLLAVLGPPPTRAQAGDATAIAGLELVETRLPLDWLASDRASVRKAGQAVAELAEARGADIIQLHSAALAAENRFRRPVLAVAHSCVATWWQAVKGTRVDSPFRWRSDVMTAGLRAADLVVAPSRAAAEATMKVHGLDALPTVVHNGRAPLRLPKVAPHDFAFTAGRLWDKGKNMATLDRAAARLAIPFYAAGRATGPNGDAIDLGHAHGLGNLSEEELARWLAARPVFASAALYEPFGLAVLEAAAAGCPLVLSDIPTFRELWDGAATFVGPTDHEGFAAAISDIAGDDLLRRAMGDRAKARAARFTPGAMALKMAGLYRTLARTPAEAAGGKKVAA